MHEFKKLIGEGELEFTIWHILIRTLIIFILTVLIIRLSDRRAYSLLSPFENVIIFLQGSILGRLILDPATPFLPALAGAGMISILHWVVARLAVTSPAFQKMLKGKSTVLYENDQTNKKNMRKSNISDEDLEERVRRMAGVKSLEEIETIYLERDGNMSIIKKSGDS